MSRARWPGSAGVPAVPDAVGGPAYARPMALELPTSLTPSKVSSFTDCALAFRYSAIDRLSEPPSAPATKGTLVHAALERLYVLAPPERTLAAALTAIDEAFDVLRHEPDYAGLGLGPEEEARFLDDAEQLVRRYFELEDPTTIHPIGLELRLEIELDGLTLRGVIDRLELDRRPTRVQLLYLADPVAITTVPTEQSIRGLERKVRAIWSAIERACARDDFRPRVSRLCTGCAFADRCPAYADAQNAEDVTDVADGAGAPGAVDPPLALRSAG